MRFERKSSALLIILSMIILISIIAKIGIDFTVSNRTLNLKIINSTRALYFAEAGLKKAMYEIKNNADPSSKSGVWIFAGQSVTITIDPDPAATPDEYRVISENTFKNCQKRIQAAVRKDCVNNTVELLEWQEI